MMAHRHRSGSDPGAPMVIDSGARGLEQSRWHSAAGLSQYSTIPRNEPDTDEQRVLQGPTMQSYQKTIASLVPAEAFPRVWQTISLILELEVSRHRTASAAEKSSPGPEPGFTQQAIQAAVTTAIKTSLETALQDTFGRYVPSISPPDSSRTGSSAPTYASVAASQGPSLRHLSRTPSIEKPIPARHDSELLIRNRGAPEQITKRSPPEIVQAVNNALPEPAAIAARKLPSGDTAVVFNIPITSLPKDDAWVQSAFGAEAHIARRVYTVVAKNVRTSATLGDLADLAAEISNTNNVEVVSVKPMRSRSEAGPRRTLILNVASPPEANVLCELGAVIAAEICPCGPYEESLQPRQCYSCYQYGHIARHCKAEPRCGRCGATAHKEGTQCPAANGSAPAKCLLCKRGHPAWSGSCPVAEEQRTRAKEAYLYRPTRFQEHSRPTRSLGAPVLNHSDSEPAAKRKRPIGRPPGTRNNIDRNGPTTHPNTISAAFTRQSRPASVSTPQRDTYAQPRTFPQSQPTANYRNPTHD